MRAVRFAEFGDPGVLSVGEMADPRAPSGDELLVRVEASSVNGTDLGLRRGDLKIATWGRMPFVPGFDLAGEVVACGPQVTAFSPGDRVMALLGHGGGGQAEQVLLRQGRAASVPRSCSVVEAAALPLAGLTALQALYRHAGLQARPGAHVLVMGAAGGIGSFAVQLALRTGAHVTGVASSAKLAFAAALGCEELLDYQGEDVTASGQRWDVIFDSPGRYSFAALRHLLRPGGVMVSTRPVAKDTPRILTTALRRAGQPQYAAVMTQARSQDLAHLAALVDRGQLRTNVHRSFPMTRAAEAHQLAGTTATGKVVLEAPWT